MIDQEEADGTAVCVGEVAALLDDVAPDKVAWLLGEARIRADLAWQRGRRTELPAAGR